jgi:PKD repeat protein
LNISTPNAPVPTVSYTTNQISTTATSADVEFDATGSSNYTSVLWDFGGGNANPNPVATYTYTMNQTYSVTLTLTNGCGTVDSTFDVTVTGIGINETALAKSLNIYPNPTNGAFTVRFALEKREAVNVTVLDPIGRIIERKDLGTVEGATEIAFDLSDEASGVYMVQITTDSGVITKRITVRNK